MAGSGLAGSIHGMGFFHGKAPRWEGMWDDWLGVSQEGNGVTDNGLALIYGKP